MSQGRNHLVISADGHCGADLLGYKPYLETKYHEDFDRWAAEFDDPWGALDTELEDYRVGVSSYASDLNWDSDRRLAITDKEGIAAEVLFPNTAPPFFPAGLIGAHPPVSQSEYEYRLAGIKAHNRWLVDFCQETPGRRAGIAQLFLNDVDDALAEIRWAHDHGLPGVLLPPDHVFQLSNIYYPRFDAVWRLCEELNMPIHRHGVVPSEAATEEAGIAAPAIGIAEAGFFSNRAITQLVLAGVFDRFPNLKLVMTESRPARVLPALQYLDQFVRTSRIEGSIAYMFGNKATTALKRMPSEYLSTNIYHGSFLDSADIEQRYDAGVDHIMWGADLPHHEGTAPYSREALRLNFAGLPKDEVRQMLSLTAINVYGFDERALRQVADRIGPSAEELDEPFDAANLAPEVNPLCPTFLDARQQLLAS